MLHLSNYFLEKKLLKLKNLKRDFLGHQALYLVKNDNRKEKDIISAKTFREGNERSHMKTIREENEKSKMKTILENNERSNM